MKVIIMQGIPGSGKSHHVREMVRACHTHRVKTLVVSADDFYMKNGRYEYDVTKINEAHHQCMRRFVDALVRQRVDTIFVDNTNINSLGIAPYVAVAQAYGYEVEIRRVICDPEVALARNTHGVPAKIVHDMAERLTKYPLPGPWKVVEIQS